MAVVVSDPVLPPLHQLATEECRRQATTRYRTPDGQSHLAETTHSHRLRGTNTPILLSFMQVAARTRRDSCSGFDSARFPCSSALHHSSLPLYTGPSLGYSSLATPPCLDRLAPIIPICMPGPASLRTPTVHSPHVHSSPFRLCGAKSNPRHLQATESRNPIPCIIHTVAHTCPGSAHLWPCADSPASFPTPSPPPPPNRCCSTPSAPERQKRLCSTAAVSEPKLGPDNVSSSSARSIVAAARIAGRLSMI